MLDELINMKYYKKKGDLSTCIFYNSNFFIQYILKIIKLKNHESKVQNHNKVILYTIIEHLT